MVMDEIDTCITVDVKVARPIAYPLARTLSVAYLILKLLRIS